MDLSLLIFTLETYRFCHGFCVKCIESPTRTYNFKNLAVGSLIWSAKTGVNSSYFPQKISTCPVLCCILTLSASRVASRMLLWRTALLITCPSSSLQSCSGHEIGAIVSLAHLVAFCLFPCFYFKNSTIDCEHENYSKKNKTGSCVLRRFDGPPSAATA